jgi:hypothetical protein
MPILLLLYCHICCVGGYFEFGLMQDSADGKAYEDSLRQLLGAPPVCQLSVAGWCFCLPSMQPCSARGTIGVLFPSVGLKQCGFSVLCAQAVVRGRLSLRWAPAGSGFCGFYRYSTCGMPAGESLNPEQEGTAAEELALLESQLADAEALEMPRVPRTQVAAEEKAAEGQQESSTAAAAQGGAGKAVEIDERTEEALLAQLPDVPTTAVQRPAGEKEAAAKEEPMLAG